MTEAGARMADVGGDVLRQENARGLAGFSADESRTLVTLLQRFTGGLEEGT